MRKYWPAAMFLVAALFYWYEFLLRVSINPLSAELSRDFAIDAGGLGNLSGAYFISYALLQLPAGLLADKFGPRRLLTFAIILCATSTLLFSYTNSFFLACLARFFIGAGSAFAFVCCMKIITIWFKKERFPLLSGVTLTIGSFGAASGVAVLGIILAVVPWRNMMYVAGIVGLVLGLIAWLAIRDEDKRSRDEQGSQYAGIKFLHCIQAVLHKKQNWLIALYGMLTTAPSDALGGAWGVSFLKQVHGLDEKSASVACSMIFLGLAIGSPFMGWVSNKVKNRKQVVFWGSIGAAVSLSALIFTPQIGIFTAGILFFFSGLFGAYVMCFVIINDVVSSTYISAAVGFVNMICMLGSTVLVWGMGHCLTWLEPIPVIIGTQVTYSATSYQIVFAIAPIFYLLSAFIITPLLKESYKEHK